MIRTEVLAQSVIDLAHERGDEGIEDFLLFLKKRNLLQLLPSIMNHIEEIERQSLKRDEVILTTSTQISDDLQDKIKIFSGATKESRLIHTVDTRLIGGFVVRYKDHLIDASVKKQLERLKEKLTH
jgi:F-type H+-transporting ATPase subunit delta